MFWLLAVFGSAALLTLGAWIWFQVFNRHVLKICRAIPCAQPCCPLIGNILMFTCSHERFTENLLKSLERSVLKGQRAVCFWIGFYPIIFVNHPGDNSKILNNSLSRGKEMEESSKDYCKYGLLTAPLDHWRKSRRHLNPSFHPRQMEQLMSTFNSSSKKLVVDLSTHVDSTEFDVMPHIMTAALNSMFSFLFGPGSLDCILSEEFEDCRHALELAAELAAVRLYKPWLRIDTIYKMFYGKEVELVKKSFRTICRVKMVCSERELKDRGHSDCSFQTVIDRMCDWQKKDVSITNEHVMNEMSSFFAAGTDSIGATVSYCLLALATYPHIQENIYEEIRSVVSVNDGEDISFMYLNRMTYLENVIKETLRFFTVIPFTARMPSKDIDLEDYKIPANKTTFICLYSTSFNPKYFPNPRQFNPENFTPEISQDTFMPFSRGPRNCIGKQYSMMLMKVMIAHLVQNYIISTNMDIYNLKGRKLMVTLPLCDGYHVSLRKRIK